MRSVASRLSSVSIDAMIAMVNAVTHTALLVIALHNGDSRAASNSPSDPITGRLTNCSPCTTRSGPNTRFKPAQTNTATNAPGTIAKRFMKG